MPRYGQLVMGPAGCGKSTYCSNIVKHCECLRRTVHVVNLDPAAEHFDYPVLADIRELIEVDDAMDDQDLRFGPNGGLIFCMEYLTQNFDWLQEQLDEVEDDYILFDCPGQVELYTHIPVMRQLVDTLQNWNFRLCGVFLVDSQFMIESSKFVSGVLTALSTMVTLEIPHVNVMTKLDLLSNKAKKSLDRYLEPDLHVLLNEEFENSKSCPKFKKLNGAIANMHNIGYTCQPVLMMEEEPGEKPPKEPLTHKKLLASFVTYPHWPNLRLEPIQTEIDDYSSVKFLPLDQTDEDSINDILIQIDTAIQYGEDLEPREVREREEDEEDNNVDSGFDG